MEHEQHRVEPHLAGAADARVNQLVLGDEEGRAGGQEHVADDRVGIGRSMNDQPSVTGSDGQGIERVPVPFPARQAASAVVPALVDQHGERLQGRRDEEDGEGQDHVRLSSAPAMVRPGPKARLATTVPGAIV